jgi:CheY-like chemotaxis protein
MSMSRRYKPFILEVDNNVDDRFHTSMLLQQLEYTICTARTVKEALEFMSVAPPAAIISEAGIAGANLIYRIKKDARFSDVPLILLSSSPDPALEDRALRGEYTAFLRKPVNVEELYRVLQAAVEKVPRRNIRTATSLNAIMEDGLPGADGYVTVLSEYGMFFRSLDARTTNSRLPVSLEIKGRTIKLEVVVLYSYSFTEGPFKEPGMGMKIVKINPEDQEYIKAYILEQFHNGIR